MWKPEPSGCKHVREVPAHITNPVISGLIYRTVCWKSHAGCRTLAASFGCSFPDLFHNCHVLQNTAVCEGLLTSGNGLWSVMTRRLEFSLSKTRKLDPRLQNISLCIREHLVITGCGQGFEPLHVVMIQMFAYR